MKIILCLLSLSFFNILFVNSQGTIPPPPEPKSRPYSNLISVSSIGGVCILMSFAILIYYIYSRFMNQKVYEYWLKMHSIGHHLSFKDISYSVNDLFKQKKVLKNISGEIPQGKLVAIMGWLIINNKRL